MFLYIFAGFPRNGFNAGGLRLVSEMESLGVLEEDRYIQYRKEGIFFVTPEGEERKEDIEWRMSDLCVRDGITWRWFPENWSFGNGVTVHKSTAIYETRTIIHNSQVGLSLKVSHKSSEGWNKYEARWLPGMCPQESHVVHLTWLAMKHRLGDAAYERLRQLIEDDRPQQIDPKLYAPKHFSEIRKWNGPM